MKKRAFTLFELLVSISIIGILIAVASLSYGGAQKKARDSRRADDMKAIQKAAEMYYSQNSYVYPSTTGPTGDFVAGGVMQQFPKDPKSVGWTAYSYSIATTYCACAAVENKANGNSSNKNCNWSNDPTGTAWYCVKSQQ